MRLIQVLVGDQLLDETLARLDEARVDYAVVQEEGDRPESTLIQFPVPTEAVDEVLVTLREEVGIADDAFTVVAEAETATTEHIEELQEEYAESDEGDDTLAGDELLTKAVDLNPHPVTYFSMTLFSTAVATAGLLRNSAAAVVGAMVIAPFFGTALSIDAGICCNDYEVFVDGIKAQLAGLFVAVAGATGFAWLARAYSFVPRNVVLIQSTQFSLFMTPSLLSVVVAVGAGAAGAFALATSLPVALAGVAVAAAITPSAAALGISLAWHDLTLAAGALSLLAVNVTAVNLTGLVCMLYLGYWPDVDFGRLRSVGPGRGLSDFSPSARVTTHALLAVALVGLVVVTGVAAYNQVTFDQTVNAEVQETIAEEHPDLRVAGVIVEYRGGPFMPRSETVTVEVIRTTDRPYSALSRVLERQVQRRTGTNVNVRVHFIDYEGS